MTEIPEHLLERSRSRRAALTGEGGSTDAAAPATTESSDAPAAKAESAAPAPAAAAAPAPEPEPEPTPPWVEAAESRQRAPWWAAAALATMLPFFIIYPWTLGVGGDEEGPLALGAEVYDVSCAACHGATGGGGVGPALSGGAVVESFPEPADQVTWVALGSAGYQEEGLSSYGDGKPIAGGMPGQEASLSPAEIMEVVLHERVEYGGEEFDAAVWEAGFEEEITALLPDEAEEYMAVLEEWVADPPTG